MNEFRLTGEKNIIEHMRKDYYIHINNFIMHNFPDIMGTSFKNCYLKMKPEITIGQDQLYF